MVLELLRIIGGLSRIVAHFRVTEDCPTDCSQARQPVLTDTQSGSCLSFARLLAVEWVGSRHEQSIAWPRVPPICSSAGPAGEEDRAGDGNGSATYAAGCLVC